MEETKSPELIRLGKNIRELRTREGVSQEDLALHEIGMTNGRESGVLRMLLIAWAQTDPAAAIAYADENTNGRFDRTTILTEWVRKMRKPPLAGQKPRTMMMKLIHRWSALSILDLPQATELMAEMPRSRKRGTALRSAVNRLFLQDPEAANGCATSQPMAIIKLAEKTSVVSSLLSLPDPKRLRRPGLPYGTASRIRLPALSEPLSFSLHPDNAKVVATNSRSIGPSFFRLFDFSNVPMHRLLQLNCTCSQRSYRHFNRIS